MRKPFKGGFSSRSNLNQFSGDFAHLYIEVFKRHSVSPEQLHGVPGHEADSKETLHLVQARPLGHLATQTGREGE